MLPLTPPTFEEFEREATRGNVVPVTRAVLADLQTPLGAFIRIAGEAPHAFLLESIEGGERLARYSFIGANPSMIVRARGNQTAIQREGREEIIDQTAISFVREYFRGKTLARRPGLAPFCGGAVGYLGYDAARWFEPVLADNGSDKSPSSEAAWMFFRNVLAFDRVQQQIEITSVVFVEDAAGDRERLRGLYEEAIQETNSIADRLSELAQAPANQPTLGQTTVHFQSSWPRAKFEGAVDTVKSTSLRATVTRS
jgi:anthranilate synthase component 1